MTIHVDRAPSGPRPAGAAPPGPDAEFCRGLPDCADAALPRPDPDIHLRTLMRLHFINNALEIPSCDAFKQALAKDARDRSLMEYIIDKFERERAGAGFRYKSHFRDAQVKGLSGLGLYVHEFAEQWLNTQKYGLSLDQIRDETRRLEVYPGAHTDAVHAQYLYLQHEAAKRGYALELPALMAADPLACTFHYANPPEQMFYWNNGNYLLGLLGGYLGSAPVPAVNQVLEAMRFFGSTSLPAPEALSWAGATKESIAAEYCAGTLFTHALFLQNIAPLVPRLSGRIVTADIKCCHTLAATLSGMMGVRAFQDFAAAGDLDGIEYRANQALHPRGCAVLMEAVRTAADQIARAPRLDYLDFERLARQGDYPGLIALLDSARAV